MEFVNERPPFGDLFSPPRQTLNADNEYLCNVGLIILIAGSLTPELPPMIAAKMAELHGGHAADYIVSQASITPYVISCPNSRLRDRIVQGGTYSLAQTQIRFTVHEWRPRFGMGYHPPTHQAWIKITGLPLQAWTVPEITSFIQNFGYPLQILPFGRAAGQFTDITALIATMHPTNIPLAYRYREGDYSAQVDILLLACRVWSDEHFPSPTDLDRQNDPHFQPHPFAHQNDAAISPHRSSSSSSNSAPSEPTIDYSSWSPRSFCLGRDSMHKGVPKLRGPPVCSDLQTMQPPLPPTSAEKKLSNTMKKKLTLLQYHLATEDPILLHKFRCMFSLLMSTLSLSSLRHISINPTPFLQTLHRDSNKWGGARGENLSYSISPVRPTLTPHLTLAAIRSSPAQMILIAYLKEKIVMGQAPRKPIKLSFCFLSPARPPITLSPLQAHQYYPALQITIHDLSPPNNLIAAGPSYQNFLLPPSTNEDDPTMNHSDFEIGFPVFPVLHVTKNDALKPASTNKDPLTSANHSSSLMSNSSSKLKMVNTNRKDQHLSPTRPASGAAQKRDTHLPIRRSKRLQAKHQTRYTATSSPTTKKTKLAKLPFDLHSSLTNLDATATLQILQATGLQIDSQIEQMVHDAVEKDEAVEDNQSARPSTPLHDHTPPLLIPGTDILL